MKCVFMAVLALVAGGSVRATDLRIIQLDLARQMETTAFISNYIDRVSAFGYNALELYLEGRVGTKTFSLPEGERYTPEEMRGIVAHAKEKGMIVVPVVSFLGHAEQFFKYPGLESICETREGNFRLGNRHNAFCHSAPGAIAFFENYIADLCEIFTDPYFHAGFDEAWNSGICSLCAPKEKRDELFAEEVLNIHRILARHGKRMMMWDDFFGFHPGVLEKMPRDIVMMHWNYDCNISDRGARFNFTGRLREDAFAKYAALGFEAIPCAWYEPDNIRSFIRYARRSRTAGYLQTQWEDLIPNFHGGSLPRALAASILLDDPAGGVVEDAFLRAVRRLFPSLSDLEVAATVRILERPGDALAGQVLEASVLAQTLGPVDPDSLSERALFDDILCRARTARLQTTFKKAKDILTDPRRTTADIFAAKRILEPLPADAQALAKRRSEQFKSWRNGCTPNGVCNAPESVARESKQLMDGATLATPDEKRLLLELTLVDYFGIPRWKVDGRFADGWREIARGSWKPASNGPAVFTAKVPFRSKEMPSDLRFTYSGYGTADLRYASVEGRDTLRVPDAVLSSQGRVDNPSAVLTDDLEAVRFGRPGYLVPFHDEREARAQSILTVSLRDVRVHP